MKTLEKLLAGLIGMSAINGLSADSLSTSSTYLSPVQPVVENVQPLSGIIMTLIDNNYLPMDTNTYSTLFSAAERESYKFDPSKNLTTLFSVNKLDSTNYSVAIGSGMIIDQKGHIFTASHVVGGSSYSDSEISALVIKPDNKIVLRKVVVEAYSENSDIAIARLITEGDELNYIKTPRLSADTPIPGTKITGYCLEYMRAEETNSVLITTSDKKDKSSPTRGLRVGISIDENNKIKITPHYAKIGIMSSAGSVLERSPNIVLRGTNLFYQLLPCVIKATPGNSGYPGFSKNGTLYGAVSTGSEDQNIAGITNPDALRFMISQHMNNRR